MIVQLRYSTGRKKSITDLILETLWMTNFSRQELALLYGVHSETLSRWMRGEIEPNESSVDRIKEIHYSEWSKLEKLFDVPYVV